MKPGLVTSWANTGFTGLGLVLVWAVSAAAHDGTAPPLRQPYKAVFRINTTVSAGDLSPEAVVAKAREHGIRILVFSDQFVCRAEWGMWPLRHLVRIRRDRPSVVTVGLGRYLQRIKKLQQDNPDMVILAGLDVAPHYYWRGSLLAGNLSVHQWSEQLTLVPVSADEPFAKMPAVANPGEERRWGLASVLLLWPVVPIALGVRLLRRSRVDYEDEQGNSYRLAASPWRKRGAVLLLVLGLVFLANNAPFALPSPCSPYRDGGAEVYQGFIDWIREHTSAMVFWSAPEIRMAQELSGIDLLTEPYVQHIVETDGATGFAAIYGDARTMHLPGKEWDRILIEYCRGARKAPLWAVGERDYHGRSRIDGVVTTFLLPELSRDAVVNDGLRHGKMYASCRSDSGAEMVLEHFSVSPDAGASRPSFEDLCLTERAVRVRIVLRAVKAESSRPSATATLVRNGQVIHEESFPVSTAGHSISVSDTPPTDGRSYYRVLTTWPGGEIVSNPIFVQPLSGDRDHG